MLNNKRKDKKILVTKKYVYEAEYNPDEITSLCIIKQVDIMEINSYDAYIKYADMQFERNDKGGFINGETEIVINYDSDIAYVISDNPLLKDDYTQLTF